MADRSYRLIVEGELGDKLEPAFACSYADEGLSVVWLSITRIHRWPGQGQPRLAGGLA
jgi:hypothetical protein